MTLQKDLLEFVRLLLSEKVEFVLVGGYALAIHGAPRFTEDIDFLIHISPKNADRLVKVIDQFGFGDLGLTASDFLEPGFVIQLGMPPNRIDLITSIDGVSWQTVWESKLTYMMGDLELYVIGKEALLKNKLSTGRTKDLADAERLTQE